MCHYDKVTTLIKVPVNTTIIIVLLPYNYKCVYGYLTSFCLYLRLFVSVSGQLIYITNPSWQLLFITKSNRIVNKSRLLNGKGNRPHSLSHGSKTLVLR
jgi:hypothetical protein